MAFWASPTECQEVAPGFAFKIHSAVLFLSVLENVTYEWILFSSGSLAWVDRFQGPGVFVISDPRGPWAPRRAGPASPSVPQSPSQQLLWKGLRASARTSVAGRATASGHRLPVSGSSGPPAAPTRGLRPACPARFQSGCQGSPSPPFSSASLPHSAPSAAGGRGGDRPILRCRPCASPCSRVAGPQPELQPAQRGLCPGVRPSLTRPWLAPLTLWPRSGPSHSARRVVLSQISAAFAAEHFWDLYLVGQYIFCVSQIHLSPNHYKVFYAEKATVWKTSRFPALVLGL